MTALRVRREPPPFRKVAVETVTPRSPHLVRVTLQGDELAGLERGLPAASVRLLVPSGDGPLEVPAWTGNEFLLAGGERPVIRTYTPLAVDPHEGRLDLDVVLHDLGAVAAWARAARPGDKAAISGVGRGYAIDPTASGFVLAGDETALPAIGQLLEAIPTHAHVRVFVEVARPDARIPLPAHPGAVTTWLDLPPAAPPGTALVPAVEQVALDPDTRVWVAGEAAAVHKVRRHLFEVRGMSRAQAHVRGYWKHGRAGDPTDGAGEA